MSKHGCALFLAVLVLAACGGGGTSPTPAPASTPGPVTFIQSGGFSRNPPTLFFAIDFHGSVLRTVNGAQPLTANLSAAQTAQLYADVKNAWPLTSLPPASYPDMGSITVSWQGETSPDIFNGANAAEVALLNDFGNAYKLFPSPPP